MIFKFTKIYTYQTSAYLKNKIHYAEVLFFSKRQKYTCHFVLFLTFQISHIFMWATIGSGK